MARYSKSWTGSFGLGLAAIVTCTAAGVPALAQDGYTPPFSEVLLDRLRQNTHREKYIAQALRPLRKLDTDGDGLNQADADRETAKLKANERARTAQQFLAMDFNGDLQVDRAEIRQFIPGDPAQRGAAADRFFGKYDTDSDGIATLEEALSKEPLSRRRRRGDETAQLLSLDPNSDGRITAAELGALASATFDYFDSDSNGTLSGEEARAITAEKRLAQQVRERREAGCFFKPPSAGAQFIAYAPYGGQTISTAFVGSPDIETGIIDVTIEAGETPLYLVLSTYDAVIWRLSGATDRVERITTASFKTIHSRQDRTKHKTSAVGVIGLPKSKVRIASRDCIPNFSDQREIDAGVPQEALAALFGRKPDVMSRENPIGTLALPSLTSARFPSKQSPKPAAGFDPVIWEDATHFHRGGLEEVDPGSVVAAEPVGTYDVLPNKFGLAKLVASGHLRFEGGAFHSRKFTLLKPIARWPAGMGGALSTSFVKPDDFPMPKGRLGHSCVMDEKTAAKANWERLCRERGSSPEPAPPAQLDRGALKR